MWTCFHPAQRLGGPGPSTLKSATAGILQKALQFLFANHLDSYLRTFHADGALNPPLYLTYNYHLLDRARKTVHGILKATAHTLMDAPSDSDSSQIPDGSFKTLRQLFRSAISFRDQSGFVDSNLMTYHRFREFWTQRSRLMAPQVSKLRPALLWHVIRTYIKGMAVKSVDGYRSLATADQSVSSDTFQLILEKVWPLYNKHCVDNQLWDDQDLARQVLDVIDSGKVKVAAYPAIFCDEAQDFTHLELSLLNKFLLYSYRDMSSCRYLMKNIPFAFAGDPFQTLNPTGFSWSSIKSTYHRNVVQRLDPSNEAKLILNDQDLPVNYRSSAGIVRFANTIQFLRSKLLGHEDLRPQDSWRQVSSDCSVKYFDVNDENCKDNLRNESSLLIIVPCDEEGEADYRQSDEVLLDIIGPTEDDASRLASPSKVKGLEFDRVLLYRFGDFACKEHPRLVRAIKAFDSQRHEAPSDQDRLVWEYFLNKLYVAVSRARLQLIVVDSVSALNGFWQFALEDSELRRSLVQLQGGNAVREIEAVWRIDRLGTMEPGISSSWTEITDDPGRVAQAYEAQGRLERNPRLLRDAKSHYRRAGKSGDMNLCEAAALEIEGSLQDAARLYENEGRRNEAARCYWAESNWDKLVELGRRFPSFQSESLYRCSDIIRPQRASNVTADEVIDVLRELVTYRNNTAISEPDESQAYSRFIRALVRHLDEIISSRQAEKDHWSHLPECVEEFIADLHIQLVDVKELPNLYASCGHTSRAYDLWREINPNTTPDRKIHPRWIVLADAKRRRFPERVKLLAELDEHDAVVDSWIEEGRPVNRHECTHVVLSALRTNRLDVVGELVSVAPDLSDLCACSMDVSSSEPSVGKAMLVIAMSALASTGEWLPMIEFSEGLQQKKGHPDLRNLQSQWKWPRKMRIVTAIQILARCPELQPSKSGDIQNFLIRHFLPHLDRNRRGNASSRVGARLRDDFKQAKKSLGIAEVGAAIEAFCLPQTACKYWELYLPQARRSPQRIVVSEQTYELAKRRWIVCAQKWQSSWVGQGVNLAEKRLNDNLAIWKMNKINVDEKIRLPPIDLTDIETIAAPESLPKSTNVETESTVQGAPTVQSRQGSSSERQGSSPEIVPASPELPSSDPHPEEMPTRSRIRSEIDEEVNRSVGTLKAPRTECSLTLRFDGRVIDGLIQIPKRRIQLTDSANDDVVFCGSGDVFSHDLQVMEIDAGRVWEVIDWGVSCQIDDLGGERAIRIFSGSDELLLGFIFPESSGE